MKTRILAITDLFFAIAFSIRTTKKAGRNLLLFPLSILAFTFFDSASVRANSVKILRAITDHDQVTLKVQVRDHRDLLVPGLQANNFTVLTTAANQTEFKYRLTPLTLPKITITPPDQVKPDPAYLVILLDMSGSMDNRDESQQVKLQGAIEGIQKFITTIKTKKLPVEIALVPFGQGCAHSYPVDQTVIQKYLEAYPYKTTKTRLSQLANIDVCASTNLYQPLDEAVNFLTTSERFQQNSWGLPPRLGVILFTDGFDADPDRNKEEQRFQSTLALLARSPHVTVHTMGYGESLTRLRARAQCAQELRGRPLTVDTLLTYCQLPWGEDIREFIVDRSRLTAIAKETGGIARFPRSAEEVSQGLREFLTALREYEISYPQPTADRLTIHQAKVIVNAPGRGMSSLISAPLEFQMPNYLYHSLSIWERLAIFLGTLVATVFGVRRFNAWSHQLKEESRRNLEGF
ncbi:VWA domain-containing protein [Microcystis sp. BLCC-F209]|jgi:VWFA-related protein|uniref:VWA domain-containing protein n=1 Tax=Microcystis sp. BLCC-F209 TaxID=3342750 RepID=UPI0035B7A0BA